MKQNLPSKMNFIIVVIVHSSQISFFKINFKIEEDIKVLRNGTTENRIAKSSKYLKTLSLNGHNFVTRFVQLKNFNPLKKNLSQCEH